MSKEESLNALSKEQAYQLADITKTAPQFGALTPRWLTRFMEFKGLQSGIYRVNKVNDDYGLLKMSRTVSVLRRLRARLCLTIWTN